MEPFERKTPESSLLIPQMFHDVCVCVLAIFAQQSLNVHGCHPSFQFVGVLRPSVSSHGKAQRLLAEWDSRECLKCVGGPNACPSPFGTSVVKFHAFASLLLAFFGMFFP